MVVRIFIALGLFFVGLFIFLWLFGGGFQKIKAAIPHYYNPVQYALKGAYSGGLYFTLPGTPSFFPTLASTTNASSSDGQAPDTDVYIQGSHDYDNVPLDSTGDVQQN
ncbi:MAG: hypothetical protein JWO50_378 [Candidatus Kaiserbacteria bacterium]|nr:hypothetical protein [Candidatus Kaiserbacteria bacterium]